MIKEGHVSVYDHCSPYQEQVSGKMQCKGSQN